MGSVHAVPKLACAGSTCSRRFRFPGRDPSPIGSVEIGHMDDCMYSLVMQKQPERTMNGRRAGVRAAMWSSHISPPSVHHLGTWELCMAFRRAWLRVLTLEPALLVPYVPPMYR